jgi:hypothetical protein
LIASLIASIASSPIVQKILIPAISDALSRLFERWANRLELKAAVKQVKAAKTSDQLRAASKALGDATKR